MVVLSQYIMIPEHQCCFALWHRVEEQFPSHENHVRVLCRVKKKIIIMIIIIFKPHLVFYGHPALYRISLVFSVDNFPRSVLVITLLACCSTCSVVMILGGTTRNPFFVVVPCLFSCVPRVVF